MKRGRLFLVGALMILASASLILAVCQAYDTGDVSFVRSDVNRTGACGYSDGFYIYTDCVTVFETPSLPTDGLYTVTFNYVIGSETQIGTENFEFTCAGSNYYFEDDDINEEHLVESTVFCDFNSGVNQFTITAIDNGTDFGSVHFQNFSLSIGENNGFVDTGEECDEGSANGVVCKPDPIYGDGITCTYCSETCEYETVSAGNCSDGIENWDELGVDCGGSQCVGEKEFCSSSQLDVEFCRDYTPYGQKICENYDPDVALASAEQLGPYQEAECIWKDSECIVNIISKSLSGKDIGYCAHVLSTYGESCENGFIDYSWEGEFNWAPSNVYFFNDGNAPSEYVQINSTAFHYDPFDARNSCTEGSEAIPCPAQIKLDFFNWFNFIIAAILVGGIYFLRVGERRI